ncbi:NAD(P)H-dependent D-xylose reductase [Pleurostoma richardsiae]|uniref:NAD(P)H-dependent D-xylose reductase n=1 Tax=Pleurostoma richardsiae TaxID=41990 RepID=A0AA38VR03_9PEZI|nr:NAD(P)H-dependent D-xylose reductase [Pleurostoma richardsiae]
MSFIYGTAWKREDTAVFVSQAIKHGFTSFDTAGQPKPYREELVGEAIRQAFATGQLHNRADICIQTKFSRPEAQDPSNTAYPLDAPLEEQVHLSIQNSLHNLRHEEAEDTSYLDALLLHSPYPDLQDTVQAWRVFEQYVPSRIRALGICNVPFAKLKQLYEAVDVKPAVVQARFHKETAFEPEVRRFCAEKRIVFQAHKVLKGSNAALLESELIGEAAAELGVSRQAALYLCVLHLPGSVRIVNGTKSAAHMKEDLDAVEVLRGWGVGDAKEVLWRQYMGRFQTLIEEGSHVPS